MSAVADKLAEARALIARGWCQGRFSRGFGERRQLCCAQALQLAEPRDSDSYRAARRFVLDVAGDENLIAFNDARGRTKAGVLAVFDEAIAVARARAAQ